MAKALKCNRCKKCFDPLSIKDGEYICWFNNPIFSNREDFRKGKYTDFLFEGDFGEKIDLCPSCSDEYRLFMEGYNLAVHDNDFDKPDQEEEEEEEEPESELVKWMREHWKELEDEFQSMMRG